MWKFYNRALISAQEPNEEVDVSSIESGEIWKKEGKRAWLAMWTTDFDCGRETQWWHVVKKAPYQIETLSKSSQKHIRRSKKKCACRIVDPREHKERLWKVFASAWRQYEGGTLSVTEDEFKRGLDDVRDDVDWWGGFDAESQDLIGYTIIRKRKVSIEVETSKYDPNFLKLGVSAALKHDVLNYYLNERGFSYCSSGSRNINHITNVQEYLIQKFNFEKAYCRLHIAYRPNGVGGAIKIMFLFRKHLQKLDRFFIFHKINALLKLEEIARSFKC